MPVNIYVNGVQHQVDASPDTPLLWVLRDSIGLTGTKYGCGMSLCGACTVHLDGQAIRSCSTPLSQVIGKKITTIEVLQGDTEKNTGNNIGKTVQRAWQELEVAQCGYCQSGQMMSATALLSHNSNPSDDEIDAAMSGNICRCNSYFRIRAAIKHAAKQLSQGESA